MKTIVTFILLLSAVDDLFAAPVEWTDENRRIEAEQVALWESKIAEAQSKPPDARPADLWLGLRNMGYRRQNHDGHSPSVDAIYLRIQQELQSVPSHARYFAVEIKRGQKAVAAYPTITGPRGSYDFDRSLYFEVLTHLPSPETISVLGDFLSDDIDTPHPLRSPDSDWGENPRANSFFSAGAIMMIGLRNPPVAVERRDENPDERLAETRAWWEEIKSGKRTFSFLGQKLEYRFKPDGTWETIAMTNPPDDAPRAAKSSPLAPAMITTTRQSQGIHWIWISVGIMMLLAGVAWLRKSKRGV